MVPSPDDETSHTATLRTIDAIGSLNEADWGRLAGTTRASATDDVPYNPFISWSFLSALEDAGCCSRRTGWSPQHLALEAEGGALLGAAPVYLKSHSQGEYVFDHGWADAFERAGGDYYPKLLCAAPFTPATGPRLLATSDGARAALAGGLSTICERMGVSSAHVNFATNDDATTLEEAGFLLRNDRQFHWHNDNYGSYDDFLSTLASRKRKALRKERREALEGNGLEIEWLTGSDITEKAWDAFHTFYQDTGARKWGRPYLNRKFFSLIGERMADDVLLAMAKREGRWIAGALNFIGGDTLYGRHWGCTEHHPFLHFEVCYHQAIDFAIEHGLKVVEAGAQGEHKLARGYSPVLTRSLHYIAHPGFRRAVADYLRHERQDVQAYAELLDAHAPFRRGERTDRGAAEFAITHREVEEQE